jgi:hypothetical protein
MTLTAMQRLRLYEALGNIAEALPEPHQKLLMVVWRARAWRIRDEPEMAKVRGRIAGRIYRALPDLQRPDWRWVLAVLPDDQPRWEGDRTVFTRWAEDAGYSVRSST